MSTMLDKTKITLLITCLLCVVCFSCNQKKETIPENEILKTTPKPVDQTQADKPDKKKPLEIKPPEKPKGIDHYVQWQGETLSIIAKWYTGALENWKVLAAVNPQIDPTLLYMNTKIHIPDNLLTNSNPMPRDFLDQFYTKKQTADTDIATPEKSNEHQIESGIIDPEENIEQADTDAGEPEKDNKDVTDTDIKEPVDIKDPADIKEPEENNDDIPLFGPKTYPAN